MAQPRNGYSLPRNEDKTYAVILSTLQNLTAQMAQVVAKLDTLPDTYPTRREMNEIISSMKEALAANRTDMAALQEWRLAEMQRQATAQLGVQQHINQEAKEITFTSFQNRIANISGVAPLMLFLLGILASGFVTLLIYIAQHH